MDETIANNYNGITPNVVHSMDAKMQSAVNAIVAGLPHNAAGRLLGSFLGRVTRTGLHMPPHRRQGTPARLRRVLSYAGTSAIKIERRSFC